MTVVNIAAVRAATVEGEDPTPLAHGTVTIRLIHGGQGGSVDDTVIAAESVVRLDVDGEAAVELVPNADISPAGSFYAIAVKGEVPTLVRTIVVPEVGPVSWADVGIQVEDPSPPVVVPVPQTGDAGKAIVVVEDGNGPRFVLGAGGGGGGAPLSDDDPEALGVADPGEAEEASRADHVHAMPSAADVGAAAASHGHAIGDVSGLQTALDAKVTGTGTHSGASSGTNTGDQDLSGYATTAAFTAADLAVAAPPFPTPTGSYIINFCHTGDSVINEMAAAGRMLCYRQWIGAGTWDQFSMWVASGGTATWLFGWYPVLSTGATDWANPFTIGSLSMSSTAQRTIGISASPGAGYYDVVALVDSYTSNPQVQNAIMVGAGVPVRGIPQVATAAGNMGVYYSGVATGGGLPTSSPGAPTGMGRIPTFRFRKG